ncbi:13350_t:CDS:2, partial [Dentiscutata heterogama]
VVFVGLRTVYTEMIIDDSSSKALKKYLSHILEPICDADPDVLAEYVIALLKHDKSNQDLRQLCVDQLDDFLKEETEPFVEKLFESLVTKEYLGETSALSTLNIKQESPITNTHPTSNSSIENKSNLSQDYPTEKVENQNSKIGVRKREESEGSDDDDDRNYKHRERGGDNSRDDYRRHSDRPTTNRDDDRDSKNKRFRGEGIPTGPAAGAAQYNNNYQDDRAFKRRRDENEEDFRSNKIPRNNLLVGAGQSLPGTGNGYITGNGTGVGSVRRPDFDRDNRLNRNFMPITSNPPVPNIGSTRWGSEWGTNGMNVPVNDRFDDRRMRSGRMNDRSGGRGNSIGVNRGGYSDSRPGRRQRCRDYDGDLCPFDHGVDRIVVDDVPLNRPFDIISPMAGTPLTGPVGMMGGGVGSRPPFFMGAAGVRNQFELDTGFSQTSRAMTPTADAYDPERATLSRPEELLSPTLIESKENEIQPSSEIPTSDTTIPLTSQNIPHFLDSNTSQLARGASFRGRGRARGRAGFNGSNRFNSQTNKNATLVVENIPNEFCNLDKINEFFKKFGTITNINVDIAHHKAIIQFSNNSDAHKAYNSPEPIFDNRFVKVYWYKEKEEQPSSNTTTQKQVVAPPKPETPATVPENPAQSSAEKAKEVEEKTKKQKESLKAMLEIQKQREQLINRQIEEQKKLMELAKKKNVNAKNREEVFKTLNKVGEDIKNDTTVSVRKPILTGVVPSKNLLEEKEREQLDRELDMLSKINETGVANESSSTTSTSTAVQANSETGNSETNASAPTSSNESVSYRGRGRASLYRGRARAAWPRVRGGGVLRSFKLDNRTTKLQLKEVPAGSNDTIRNYFQQFGEIESITFADEARSAIVHFKTRYDAEQALVKGPNIPNVGTVQISWLTEANSVSRPSSEDTSNTTTNPSSNTVDAPDIQTIGNESLANVSNFEDDEDDERERSWKR